jgi:nitronate monooxygenase
VPVFSLTFSIPSREALARLRERGTVVLGTATTVAEAQLLEAAMIGTQALGAAGVQMGTAFLACREAGLTDACKQAIRAARDDQTALTRVFSGRPARGIVNQFIRDLRQHEAVILPFLLQSAAT